MIKNFHQKLTKAKTEYLIIHIICKAKITRKSTRSIYDTKGKFSPIWDVNLDSKAIDGLQNED